MATAAMLLPMVSLLLSPRAALSPRLSARMCAADMSSFTVVELKDKLRAAGLKVSGRKAELIERLSAAGAPAEELSMPVDAAEPSSLPFVEVRISHCKQ